MWTVINVTQKHLQKHFKWSDDEMPLKLTLLTSIMPFACICGIFLSPCLEKVGKRKAFMILDVGFIIGTILCITGNEYMLFVGRFI